MPMRGAKKHIDRLRKLTGPDVVKALGEVVLDAAKDVEREAQASIRRGSGSGKPSRPGRPPNEVTGKLADQIEASQTGPLSAQVASNAEYSGVHEFGSSTHPARPFMRPARDKVLGKVRGDMIAKVNRVVKKSG